MKLFCRVSFHKGQFVWLSNIVAYVKLYVVDKIAADLYGRLQLRADRRTIVIAYQIRREYFIVLVK